MCFLLLLLLLLLFVFALVAVAVAVFWQPLLPVTRHRRCPSMNQLVRLAPQNIRVQASSHRTDGGGGSRVYESLDRHVDSRLDYLLPVWMASRPLGQDVIALCALRVIPLDCMRYASLASPRIAWPRVGKQSIP